MNEKDVPCRIGGKGLNFVMVDVEEWVFPSGGLKENQIALSLLGPIGECLTKQHINGGKVFDTCGVVFVMGSKREAGRLICMVSCP